MLLCTMLLQMFPGPSLLEVAMIFETFSWFVASVNQYCRNELVTSTAYQFETLLLSLAPKFHHRSRDCVVGRHRMSCRGSLNTDRVRPPAHRTRDLRQLQAQDTAQGASQAS
ncbi:hypothetical protein B0H10DRAFT_648890 [Mycena sp. CBHHK59/15]|nr:hypothetical protein B0H10DRAFT_648890 [Mycena sp. CBHHK59/15]